MMIDGQHVVIVIRTKMTWEKLNEAGWSRSSHRWEGFAKYTSIQIPNTFQKSNTLFQKPNMPSQKSNTPSQKSDTPSQKSNRPSQKPTRSNVNWMNGQEFTWGFGPGLLYPEFQSHSPLGGKSSRQGFHNMGTEILNRKLWIMLSYLGGEMNSLISLRKYLTTCNKWNIWQVWTWAKI